MYYRRNCRSLIKEATRRRKELERFGLDWDVILSDVDKSITKLIKELSDLKKVMGRE